MIDELNAPLGQHRPAQPGLRVPDVRIAIGAVLLAAVLLSAWAMIASRPSFTQPTSVTENAS
jgi:hypothetical protein